MIGRRIPVAAITIVVLGAAIAPIVRGRDDRPIYVPSRLDPWSPGPRVDLDPGRRLIVIAVPRRRAPVPNRHVWRRSIASTYGIGDGLIGQNKANGRPLTRFEMIVAHKTLPLGTKIEIRYRGRRSIATVLDRGPYIAGRDLDLGPAVARALKFAGVGFVEWRVIK